MTQKKMQAGLAACWLAVLLVHAAANEGETTVCVTSALGRGNAGFDRHWMWVISPVGRFKRCQGLFTQAQDFDQRFGAIVIRVHASA